MWGRQLFANAARQVIWLDPWPAIEPPPRALAFLWASADHFASARIHLPRRLPLGLTFHKMIQGSTPCFIEM